MDLSARNRKILTHKTFSLINKLKFGSAKTKVLSSVFTLMSFQTQMNLFGVHVFGKYDQNVD